jgi:replicative DNA helicase
MGVREQPVAIISLEMSNIQLVCRLIMNVGEIKYEKIKAGKLSKTDEKRLNTKINILKGLPIYLEDTHSLSIIELIKKAYKLVYTKGVKVIFIDYLQLLSAAGMQYNNRAQELSIIIHELKNLAVDLQVPIIAFSQLNRSKEGSNLPQVTDIRESGDIANVADVVCLIHRPKDSDLAQIFVAKDQWGKLGTVELRFKKEYLRFENK